ncbi:MAG: cation diffusion facilitator family transporter [Leptonema sp. (in: bacteria)]
MEVKKQMNYNKIFFIGIGLNLSYVIVEIVFGLYLNSLSLISDGVHNFSDVLSLIISWLGYYLAKKKSSLRRTYGFKKSTILAAFLNSVILFMALGGIVIESIQKLFVSKYTIDIDLVWKVALLGIFINFGTAYLFHRNKGQHGDLNLKSAFIHMFGDGLITLGVILSAIIIKFTNFYWIDPLFSICIVIVIFFNSWDLFYESLNLIIDGVPKEIHVEKIKKFLESIPEIKNIHDLHIWAMSTTEIALTVHVVKSNSKSDDELLLKISNELEKNFQIRHTTIQIEQEIAQENCNQIKKCC